MAERTLKTLLLIGLFSIGSTTDEQDTIVVDTKLGAIKGTVWKSEEKGENLYEFRGIPYARPTTGAKRFTKPEPVDPWKDTLDASEFGASCPQYMPDVMADLRPDKMEEDCLFLNIFVPKKLKPGKHLSVMFWIHGGGLMNGNGDVFDGSLLTMQGDVILVTINYRLGIFGFLALDHPAAMGNYGIWDQKLALQWVHDNIESFGGNPDSVTIFGESAGGWSVSFQSLIPSNKGLFHRVIAQSGVVTRAGVLSKQMIRDDFKDLSEKVNCPVDDMYQFTDCLRDKSVEMLLNETNFFTSMSNEVAKFNAAYQPAIDGELYMEHPLLLLEDSSSDVSIFFRSLDFMAGTTSNEGNLVPMTAHPGLQARYEFNVSESIPAKFVCQGMLNPYVDRNFNTDKEQLKESLCQFYTTELSEDAQSLLATHCYADLSFVFPTLKMLENHAAGKGTTYQYLFSRESSKPINIVGPPPKWFRGAGHAEELKYMFDISRLFKHLDLGLTDEEKTLSRNIIQYWTSFAKSGRPVAGEDSVQWKEFDLEDRSYIDLDVPTTMKKSMKPDMFKFLNEKFPPLTSEKHERDEL